MRNQKIEKIYAGIIAGIVAIYIWHTAFQAVEKEKQRMDREVIIIGKPPRFSVGRKISDSYMKFLFASPKFMLPIIIIVLILEETM